MGHAMGYARVSTADQDPQLQLDALADAGCYRVFVDRASGALDARPELAAALDQLRAGDTLVVWRLDRLGRSLRHLIEVVTSLDERGVGLRSLCEQIDTSTTGGKLVFHLFGALAEFERDLIRDRTMAGLAAARARGRVGGRPPSLSPDQVAVARQLRDGRQHTMDAIAQIVGTSRATLYRHLSKPPPITSPPPPTTGPTSGHADELVDAVTAPAGPIGDQNPGSSPRRRTRSGDTPPDAPPKLKRHTDPRTAATFYTWSHPVGVALEVRWHGSGRQRYLKLQHLARSVVPAYAEWADPTSGICRTISEVRHDLNEFAHALDETTAPQGTPRERLAARNRDLG